MRVETPNGENLCQFLASNKTLGYSIAFLVLNYTFARDLFLVRAYTTIIVCFFATKILALFGKKGASPEQNMPIKTLVKNACKSSSFIKITINTIMVSEYLKKLAMQEFKKSDLPDE